MFSASKLLKYLYECNVIKPTQSVSGRAFSKGKNILFDEIYRHARYLKEKDLIELKECNEIGRSGPVDIHMKITANGIDSLNANRWYKKCLRGIGKLFEIVVKILK